MNYYFFPLFYMFFLFMSTFMVLSSSSMIVLWLGLEINLMSFIPLIFILGSGKGNSEAIVKYFLIQAISSSLILFLFMWSFMYSNYSLWISKEIIISMSLAMKVGLAPFHFWFPEVMSGMDWIGSLLIMTWQKISPLYILSMVFDQNFLMFMGVCSALTGAIMGLSQVSLQKILAFSSISHLGWISIILSLSSLNWIFYLSIYILVSLITCLCLWFLNFFHLSQIFYEENMSVKFLVFMNLLSTGGLPPLLGFSAKLVAFKELYSYTPLLLVLILSSLLTLYFYTRICISSFTMSNLSLNFLKVDKNSVSWLFLSLNIVITFLGILPVLYFL
uniref:NADH dehydrogenase subunit 2 n=1 Tax=Octolasmis warwickii TaxID=479288 RepID=UPI0021CCA622|nr:NADH dehydrogenase subunit 2 [Octolasmis warwickii]UWM12947.1 NADH dehydrogenase subunit 2 [Octolasmis warwickii]